VCPACEESEEEPIDAAGPPAFPVMKTEEVKRPESPDTPVRMIAPRNRRHPAKTLMLIATIAWPIAAIGFSVMLFVESITKMVPFGDDLYRYPNTATTYSRAELLSSSIITGCGITTALYFAAMCILMVVWFTTKTEECN